MARAYEIHPSWDNWATLGRRVIAPHKLVLPFFLDRCVIGARANFRGKAPFVCLEGISKPGGRGSRRAEPNRIPLETWLSRSFALPICGFEVPSSLGRRPGPFGWVIVLRANGPAICQRCECRPSQRRVLAWLNVFVSACFVEQLCATFPTDSLVNRAHQSTATNCRAVGPCDRGVHRNLGLQPARQTNGALPLKFARAPITHRSRKRQRQLVWYAQLGHRGDTGSTSCPKSSGRGNGYDLEHHVPRHQDFSRGSNSFAIY
jgi:hypothetical protein